MELDLETNNITFSDILLVPKKSKIETRSDISLVSILGNPKNKDAWIRLENPFIIAPMEFINSSKMIQAIIERGGLAFVHRWQNKEKRIEQIKYLSKNVATIKRLGFSISVDESYDELFIKEILSFNINIILIDTAFGHTDVCINAVKQLRSIIPNNIHIMTGNVSSYEAYNDLMDAGADSVRVGIGGGAACITRAVTGFGIPVLSSILEIYKNINQQEVNGIISDGGIDNTSDIVKALAAGASAVMMGKMFAGHDECDTLNNQMVFRGIASEQTYTSMFKHNNNPHIEGVEGIVQKRGKVMDTISQMINNVQSGLSYCGTNNLISFRNECRYIKVSSYAVRESSARL